jgi:dimethylaniline monooxygenase (N-oxide forming) / hypotaurine monooxygenase
LAKRVAVVGAGSSGLVTAKKLLEEGHEPTCFERAAGLGRVFRFGHGTRSASVDQLVSIVLESITEREQEVAS